MYSYFSDVCNALSNSTVNNVTVLYIIIKKKTRISSDDVSEAQTVFFMTKISDIFRFCFFLNNFPRNT